MSRPQPGFFLSHFVLYLGILLWVVDSSHIDFSHVINRSNPELVPVIGKWPDIPFTVAINQTTSAPIWLRFSHGGRTGTVQQGLVLDMLSANLATTFADSNSTVNITKSSVENQDQKVFIFFKLNQRTLSMRSYSAAMEKLNIFVKQWGAKELDFEVGGGPQNSRAQGVFQVRLSGKPLPGDTGNTTAGWRVSDNFSLVISTPGRSSALWANKSMSTGLPALTASTTPLTAIGLTAVGFSITANTNLTRQSAAVLNGIGLIENTNANVTRRSSAAISNNVYIPTTADVTLYSTAAASSSIGISASGATTMKTQSTRTAFNASGVAVSTNATLTTQSAAAGGAVPHRDGHGLGAIAGAGAAAGAIGVGLGSGPAAALPGAAPVAAVNAAAESPENEDDGQEADPEDEDEDGNQSLSIGNQPKSQSQAPGSQTGNQLTSQSQAPTSQLSIQVASTIATPQGSRTLAATSFLTTVAPYKTSSIVVSNMTITPCPTCTACPGFQVNVAAPPSNSTSDDDNDDGDDIDDIDDDSNDGDSNSKKRALARRFYRQKRETPIVRNWVGSESSKCYVSVFTRKPAYPGPNKIAQFDGAPNVPASMTKVYETAKYWAVPSDVPEGSCEAPSWRLRDTPSILSTDPAINPNPWLLGGSGSYAINVDHIYEVQLLNMFFYTRLLDPGDQYFIRCDDIEKVFDVVDDPSHPELGTRLNVTFNKLASYENPEFLGMSELMNTKKGTIFSYQFRLDLKDGRSPVVLGKGKGPRKAKPITQQLAQFALTLNILQNATIWSLFEQTNSRIYQEFQRIDQLIQYRADNDCADKFLNASGDPLPATWADSYSSFITAKISTANKGLQLVATKAVNAVPTDDSPKFKVPPDEVGDGARTWAPWLSTFTSNFPVAQMTLPSVTAWPALLPVEFGPGDCAAAVPATSSGLAPIATALAVSSPFVSSLLSAAATSAVSTATSVAANASNGDPCGPVHQDTPDYPNTCNAKVDLVQFPLAYGVNCSSRNPSDVHPSGFKAEQIEMAWGNCMSSVQQICRTVDNSSNPTGYWIWSYQTEGCAVGVYLPSFSGSAPPPSPERCQTLIFEAIVNSCSTTTIPSSMGSVNVVSNPSYLMSDISQGSQVNAGYPSYIVSPTMPGWLGNPPAPWPLPDRGNPWAESPPKPFTPTINVGEHGGAPVG